MSSSNAGANTSSNYPSNPAKAIAAARKEIGELLKTPEFGPQFIRIAFYDAISYDPIAKVDGPNGSIRIWEGLEQEQGMKTAIENLDNLKKGLYLDAPPTLKSNLAPYLSYADLYQLAGIEAIKKAGGPNIDFQPGRTDSCIPSNKLPIIKEDAKAEFVKNKFHRIGFTDKEIVALSSAYFYWMNYTQIPELDNSFYKKLLEVAKPQPSNAANTLSTPTNYKLPTQSTLPSTPPSSTLHYWACLLSDASFCKHVEQFAKDKDYFAKEYASAHKKLSELGFKHIPEPIFTETEYHDIKHGIAFAVAMTILFGFVGFFYEAMRA